MEILGQLVILVIILAFIFEFFDSYAGMGFGTIVPVLILLGHEPLEVIPTVLFCGGILSLMAGFLHQQAENVDLFEQNNFKVLSIFLIAGVIGVTVGVLIAINIPMIFLEIYIGLVLVAIGIMILVSYKMKNNFSWRKIVAFGSLASFNKGITGGGFGPVLSGGGILAGLDSKSVVGMAMMAEGVVSFFGVAIYAYLEGFEYLNWSLIASLLIGGLAAVPVAVYAVKKVAPKSVRLVTGVVSLVIGAGMFMKLLL